MSYIEGLFDGAAILAVISEMGVATWYHDLPRYGWIALASFVYVGLRVVIFD